MSVCLLTPLRNLVPVNFRNDGYLRFGYRQTPPSNGTCDANGKFIERQIPNSCGSDHAK